MSYAEGDYSRAAEFFGKVRREGMPTAMADYYLAQMHYMAGRHREELPRRRRLCLPARMLSRSLPPRRAGSPANHSMRWAIRAKPCSCSALM